MADYERIAQRIGALTNRKGQAYGDSAAGKGADVLRLLWPNGIPAAKYAAVPLITRIVDKLFRIANQGDAFGEDPWQDIVGYALIGSSLCEVPGEPSDDEHVTL